MKIVDKALGGFLGLAIGDALGAQVEFKPPGTFPLVTDMVGGGVYNLLPGQITDDTIMSILSTRSLLECKEFSAHHMMDLFYKWSSSPECFDIGTTIQEAIYAYKRTGDPFQGIDDENYSGNGSLMRIYPSILWTLDLNDVDAFSIVWDISRLTHASPIVYDVSLSFFKILRKILLADSIQKDEILKGLKIQLPSRSSGFVLDTFNVALWGFANSESFEEGVLKVVNLGDDADTAGAVYGQLAGSFYGVNALPERFLRHIREKDEISGLVLRMIKR